MKAKRNSTTLSPGAAADLLISLRAREKTEADEAAEEARAKVLNKFAEKAQTIMARSTDPEQTMRMLSAVTSVAKQNGGTVRPERTTE